LHFLKCDQASFEKEEISLKKKYCLWNLILYVSLLSEESGKMNYPKAFFVGLLSNFKANKIWVSSHIYVLKK
jgi:hypothetical protein